MFVIPNENNVIADNLKRIAALVASAADKRHVGDTRAAAGHLAR